MVLIPGKGHLEEIASHTRELVKRQLSNYGKPPSVLKQIVLKCFKPLRKYTEQQRVKNERVPDFYERIIQRMIDVGDIELIKEGKKIRYKLKGH